MCIFWRHIYFFNLLFYCIHIFFLRSHNLCQRACRWFLRPMLNVVTRAIHASGQLPCEYSLLNCLAGRKVLPPQNPRVGANRGRTWCACLENTGLLQFANGVDHLGREWEGKIETIGVFIEPGEIKGGRVLFNWVAYAWSSTNGTIRRFVWLWFSCARFLLIGFWALLE